MYSNSEIKNIFNKSLLKEFINLPKISIKFISLNYNLFLKYSMYRSRCLISNKVRAFIKKFMMSRMSFKKLALNGYIIGVKKAS
jgi:ribosomal protein S14